MNLKFWKKPTPEDEQFEEPLAPDEAILHKWNQELYRKIVPIIGIVVVLWMNALVRVIVYFDTLNTAELVSAFLPVIIVVPLYATVFLLLTQHFKAKYNRYDTFDLTIYETVGKRFRDYFSVLSVDPIKWTSKHAKAALEALRSLRRKKYLVTESKSKKSQRKVAGEVGEELERTIKHGGALSGLRFYIIRFAFRKEDDPYRQILIVSDVDIQKHYNPTPDRVYVGPIGVDKPCNHLSAIRIGTGLEQIPVLLFVESKENIERVLNQDQMLKNVPEMLVEAQRSHDILLSKTVVEICVDQAKEIESLKEVLAKQRKGGYPLADQILRIRREFGEQAKPLLTRRQVKWLLIGIIVSVLAVIAGYVAFNLIRTFIVYGSVLAPTLPRVGFVEAFSRLGPPTHLLKVILR